MVYVVFICSVVVLVVVTLILKSQVIIARRERYELARQIAKEREATSAILKLSGEIVSENKSDEEFLSRFIEYTLRTLKGCGAAVFTTKGHSNDNNFYGCAVAGIFPPLKEVSAQIEERLIAHAKKHTEFLRGVKADFKISDIETITGDKGYAFFHNTLPKGFPAKFLKDAPRILIAPIKRKETVLGCVIVTSRDEFDSYKISETDGNYLVRLAEIASMSLEVIQIFRERQEYEEKLQNAKEEGMLQVSTGIIHNIGNAVTVAKLTIMELEDTLGKNEDENPASFVLQEILPKLREELAKGTLQQFLAEDKIGKQYLSVTEEILQHLETITTNALAQVDSLSNKLYHISEIIELQQRFVGELGTENLAQISNVVESAIKIYEESCNKHGVKIEVHQTETLPEVLIDTSMMTQVFMNLIKNAVEAMNSERDQNKEHKIIIDMNTLKDKEKGDFIQIKVSDTGPGISPDELPKIFEFGYSTKEQRSRSRGFGLHSCKETVKKYGGDILVDSQLGKGTTFTVLIPFHREQD